MPCKRQCWESTERGLPEFPGFNFPPTAEPAGPAHKIMPLIALARAATPNFSVSAVPQLPRPLAFPLGESSRKRSLIVPARGQWHGAAQNHTGNSWLWTAEERKQSNLLKREHFTLTAKTVSPKCKRLRRYLRNNFIFLWYVMPQSAIHPWWKLRLKYRLIEIHMNEIGNVWYTHSVNLDLHVWTVVKEKLHF